MSLPGNTRRPEAIPAASSQAQVDIAASSERVWDLLSNIDRWPQWNALVQAAELSGPLLPGSVFRWKSKGLTIVSTLQDVTPNQRLTWTGKAFGTRAIHTWEIAETDRGVVLRTAESFDGWLPRLMPRSMQRTLDATLPAWLQAIKSEAETRPQPLRP
jgi:uncharacterized protein YndB with AHSA1/START domain